MSSCTARVRALRAFPPLVLRVLPSLRVLAVGDDQPKFRSENERLGVDEPGVDQYEESADVLDEMRQLSVEGRPGRNTRWWRVDGTGEGRELVEIWEGKGELALETLKQPDFNVDRDLDCEYSLGYHPRIGELTSRDTDRAVPSLCSCL